MRLPITLLVIAGLGFICACTNDREARLRSRVLEARGAAQTGPSAARSNPPQCPAGGVRMLRSSDPNTGHHKVILSWNSSAPSPDPKDNAVGYCLYRSKKKNAVKKDPTCKDCEQINLIPVVGTGCVDDLVEDGVTYYYVATAINNRPKLSFSSNEVRTIIPQSPKSLSSVPPSSLPYCRGTTNGQETPGR